MFPLYTSDHINLMMMIEFGIRMILAMACGTVIGYERSRRFKGAGLRTHVIVCCAAALLMVISKYGFSDLASTTGHVLTGTRDADPARIAAQVVSGISFLGAGVIFKNGNTVKGLTTAAGLWATAGIGLAIGCGGSMYLIGLFTTVLIMVLQIIMHKFKVGSDSMTSHRLTMEVRDHEAFAKELPEMLKEWKAKVTETKIKIGEDGGAKYDITMRMADSFEMQDVIDVLSQNSGIKSIGYVSSD
jgi:putative Mg2+ transporter-C (MgtC) family protein